MLKNILYEIYVLPIEKKERRFSIQKIKEKLSKDKKIS